MQVTSVMQRSSAITLVVFLILILGCAGVTFWMVGPYLLAVAIGGIFALLVNPLYWRLLSHLSPKWASLVVTLLILFLVIGPASTFVTLAVRQGVDIAQDLANREDISFHVLINRIAHWRWMRPFVEDAAALEQYIVDVTKSISKSSAGVLVGIASNIPNILLELVLAVISCYFFLIDGKEFAYWMKDKIPLDSDIRATLAASFKSTTVSVIWATLAAASAQAAIILGSFLILRIPMAFLAAGAVFIFAWIPMIGSAPIWISGALYLYFQEEVVKCIIMVAFGIVTSIIDNIIRPVVLKGRGGMHPLISLVAIFGGIKMFGIFGVFLGPILTAILISLLETWPSVAERFGIAPEKK